MSIFVTVDAYYVAPYIPHIMSDVDKLCLTLV
jgi:hypothetical protein